MPASLTTLPTPLVPRHPVPPLDVALVGDGEERAARMAEKVRAHRVRFGYGLTLAEARR